MNLQVHAWNLLNAITFWWKWQQDKTLPFHFLCRRRMRNREHIKNKRVRWHACPMCPQGRKERIPEVTINAFMACVTVAGKMNCIWNGGFPGIWWQVTIISAWDLQHKLHVVVNIGNQYIMVKCTACGNRPKRLSTSINLYILCQITLKAYANAKRGREGQRLFFVHNRLS